MTAYLFKEVRDLCLVGAAELLQYELFEVVRILVHCCGVTATPANEVHIFLMHSKISVLDTYSLRWFAHAVSASTLFSVSFILFIYLFISHNLKRKGITEWCGVRNTITRITIKLYTV